MKNNKFIIPILIIAGVLVLGGAYYFWYKNNQKKSVCTQEAKICPDGSSVGRVGPNCEFVACPEKKDYNHAGQIINIYQKDGKNYLDINLIKFVLMKGPTIIYGESEEQGGCEPGPDGYCIADSDKTIESYEVAKDIELIPSSYPGLPVPYKNLAEIVKNSPYFRLQIEDNIIKKISQIYIP